MFKFDKWTKKNTIYQLIYTALHIVDWMQTRFVAKNPERFYELNPLLGKHPSISNVNIYFILTLIGHIVISYTLPSKYRRWWQIVWIGFEVFIVAYNFTQTLG